MKNQALFSSKDKRKIKMSSADIFKVKTSVVFVTRHPLTIDKYLIASTDKESIDSADDNS